MRNRGYYREKRRNAIKRKFNILKNNWGSDEAIKHFQDSKGKLSKGKVHCSCRMCREKTKDCLKPSEIKKMNRDLDKINDLI